MRAHTFAASVLGSSLLAVCARAQLVPLWIETRPSHDLSPDPDSFQQQPVAVEPGIQMPSPKPDAPLLGDGGSSNSGSAVILSDVIGREKSINLFAGFTRDISSTSKLFADKSRNTTVLAPLNSAVRDLPWKPWEDPRQYEAFGRAQAYAGDDGAARANENLRRFVESHVVATSPWEEGEKTRTLVGNEVWWERGEDGRMVVQPGNVEVDGVVGKVSNGEVWMLKGVVNYAEEK